MVAGIERIPASQAYRTICRKEGGRQPFTLALLGVPGVWPAYATPSVRGSAKRISVKTPKRKRPTKHFLCGCVMMSDDPHG